MIVGHAGRRRLPKEFISVSYTHLRNILFHRNKFKSFRNVVGTDPSEIEALTA